MQSLRDSFAVASKQRSERLERMPPEPSSLSAAVCDRPPACHAPAAASAPCVINSHAGHTHKHLSHQAEQRPKPGVACQAEPGWAVPSGGVLSTSIVRPGGMSVLHWTWSVASAPAADDMAFIQCDLMTGRVRLTTSICRSLSMLCSSDSKWRILMLMRSIWACAAASTHLFISRASSSAITRACAIRFMCLDSPKESKQLVTGRMLLLKRCQRRLWLCLIQRCATSIACQSCQQAADDDLCTESAHLDCSSSQSRGGSCLDSCSTRRSICASKRILVNLSTMSGRVYSGLQIFSGGPSGAHVSLGCRPFRCCMQIG